MTTILAFIVAHMGFLWERARFQIVGSEVSEVNGGNAELLVASPTLRLRFLLDRDELYLDLQPAHVEGPREWYDVALVRRFVLGTDDPPAMLGPEDATFLRDRLAAVESAFAPGAWEETRSRLRALRKKRAAEQGR